MKPWILYPIMRSLFLLFLSGWLAVSAELLYGPAALRATGAGPVLCILSNGVTVDIGVINKGLVRIGLFAAVNTMPAAPGGAFVDSGAVIYDLFGRVIGSVRGRLSCAVTGDSAARMPVVKIKGVLPVSSIDWESGLENNIRQVIDRSRFLTGEAFRRHQEIFRYQPLWDSAGFTAYAYRDGERYYARSSPRIILCFYEDFLAAVVHRPEYEFAQFDHPSPLAAGYSVSIAQAATRRDRKKLQKVFLPRIVNFLDGAVRE
jgi:hypothetical protein